MTAPTHAAPPLPAEQEREGDAAPAGARTARSAHAGRLETALFRLSVGVVAVHLLDDSFLQPQPGTSAGDHLVSGLVPFAALLAAIVFAPRLGPGLRAAVAVSVGVFGVVVGIEAAYYAHAGRLSGDDYSGFAAAIAGLFLLSIGVATLWRTRRREQSLLRRWGRRLLVGVAVAVVAYVVVLRFWLSYVLTHTARAFVPADRVGARHESVSFMTADGLRLRGWYVPSKNGAAVISFPGRKGTQRQARMLARHGYGVLLFDRRGEGESDGDPNAWGWNGYRDVDAAVRFLQGRPDVRDDRIGGIGLSVGGEMMLEAAARSRGLKAVVAEGAGERSVRELLDMTGNDKWLAVSSYAALTAGIAVFSNDAPPPSLKDLVGGSPRHRCSSSTASTDRTANAT